MLAPSFEDMEKMARTAWEAMPEEFRKLAGDIHFRFEDFADEALLKDLEIEDPFELTGLYQGVDLTEASIMDPTPSQPIVTLYRSPILAEWIDLGDVHLEDLVSHVLVHEIGHHFGLSDEQMDAILEAAP